MSKKKIIALILVVLVVAGIGGWFYYKRTPAYTFSLIQTALEQKDWKGFQRHVDTENLLSTSYDVLIESSLDEDGSMDEQGKKMALGVIRMMKPNIVTSLNKDLEQWVTTGSIKAPDPGEASAMQAQAQMVGLNMLHKAGLDRLAITGVGSINKDGEMYTMPMKVHDEKLDQDFTLQLGLKQLDDGTWQILEVKNLRQYLKDMQKAMDEKVAAINGKIMEDIRKQISVGPATVERKDGDSLGITKKLQLNAPATIHSDKVISTISGEFRLQAPNAPLFAVPFNATVNEAKGTKTLALTKEINSLIPQEAGWMVMDLKKVKASVLVTRIQFQDGTVTELLREL